jgi:hypothetical protein
MMSADARVGDAEPCTIACLNIPLTWVDELMEAVVPHCPVTHRWIVFSEDMQRLGALATQWEAEVNLVVAMLPGHGRHMQEAAVAVLEAERVTLARCIWLQDKPIPTPPQGVAAVVVNRERQVDNAAAQVLRLVSVAQGPLRRV